MPNVSIPVANSEPTLELDDAEVQEAVKALRGTPFPDQARTKRQPAVSSAGLPFNGEVLPEISEPDADLRATASPDQTDNAIARAMTAIGYLARSKQAPLPPIPPAPSDHPFGEAPPAAHPPTLPPAARPPATLPPARRPPATLPPATLPPATRPPTTLPPATLPPPAAQALPAFGQAAAPAALQPLKAKPIKIRPPNPLGNAAPVVTIAAKASQPPIAPTQTGLSNRIGAQELLQLIWFDPRAVPRMRRQQDWRRILDQLEEQPQDSIVDDITLDNDAVGVENYTDTFELLSHAAAEQLRELSSIVDRGRTKDGKFVAPLALFAGQLHFPFSHLENLKATISTARPFASSDEALSHAIEDANAVVATPDLIAAPEVVLSHTKRITDAFRRVDRLVPKNYIKKQNQRALLEGRHYQRRKVFGAEHIQAQLRPSRERRNAVPTYLPAALAEQLPMYEQFQVRLIATVEPAASQYEEHTVALKVAALGRVWRPKW